MSESSAVSVANANADTGKDAIGSRQVCQFVSLIVDAARKRWKTKTAEELALLTERHCRTVARWLAKEVMPDCEATGKILLSEIGAEVFEAGIVLLPPERARIIVKQYERAVKRADRALRIAAIMQEAENDRG